MSTACNNSSGGYQNRTYVISKSHETAAEMEPVVEPLPITEPLSE